MARIDEIALFVRESLARQIPRAEVEAALRSAGWRPEQIAKALSGYADIAFPVPVPRPVTHASAGEAFIYLILFSALGISAFSVVELAFAAIEWSLPEPTSPDTYVNADYLERQVRWAVARAIIAFPVFLIASLAAARLYRADPTQRSSAVRRWLTYVAMLIAASVILGDFITLVAYLLGGETTIRFLLKVATVAIVAGIILGYYLKDVRSDVRPAVAGPLLAASSVVVVAAIAMGLWLIGSPAEKVARRLDDRRVSELREIAQAVDLHWQRQDRMAASLGQLGENLGTTAPAADPETGVPYDYRVTGVRSYEVCATFARASERVASDGEWTHGTGRQCFAREARDADEQR